MNADCFLCDNIDNGDIFFENELFFARWDDFPATPGHTLVFPRRHTQYFDELTDTELAALGATILKARNKIRQVDFRDIYKKKLSRATHPLSQTLVTRALDLLASTHQGMPTGFNFGANDGSAAGQTVPHTHWHIMPRWENDIPTPHSGIRRMFPGEEKYHL